MAQEIERKFLVSGEFKSLATKALTIKQGYLCANAGRTVRVRVRDNQGFLTIKGRSDAAGSAGSSGRRRFRLRTRSRCSFCASLGLSTRLVILWISPDILSK